MILLYESTETEFDSNGFGAIDHDIVNPEIFEQLNGQYQFTFKYPLFAKHGKEILPRRIVTAKDTDGKLQWFRITQLSKSNGYATVTAVHGTFDLTGNWIADTNIVQKDGDGAMRQIQSMSLYPHQFMLRSDITTIANARMVRMTPTQAIIDSSKDNTFISRWGGQVYRDWNTITMLKRRGTDNGVTVRYRRDISSYTADVDYSTIYTVIHPVGPDGLELPEKYVESPNVEKYGRIVTELDCSNIKLIEPQTDSEEPTEPDPEAVDTNTAFQMMRDQAHDHFENGLDVPTSNFKIDIMNLANTKEYRDVRDLVNIHPWDTVTVIHEADDVEFKAQMISYKWIPEVGEQKGHYSQIELGTEVPTYTTETAKTVNKAIDTAETAKEKAKKVDGFEKIMAETSKAVEDVKEAVANAETDVKVATATANDAVISADLAVKNAGFAKDTAQSALTSATNAQKDVETVTTNANQALNSAKTALTNAGDAIKTATDAKTTVTNLSTTVDSINGTLATLATNETVDKLSKTVTSQGTSITQNANAIALKADSTTVNTLAGSVQTLDSQLKFTNAALAAKITKSDVTSMLGGYATQTWTTSEIKAQADSINLSVEGVRQKVDGLQVGGANLLRDSNFDNPSSNDWIPKAGEIDGQFAGSNVWHFKNDTDSEIDFLQQIIQNPPGTNRIIPGRTYTFAFYARGNGALKNFVYPSTIDTSKSGIVDGNSAAMVTDGDGYVPRTLNAEMTRYTFTFTAKNPLPTSPWQAVLWRATRNSEIWITKPQLKEENNVSAYSPAPEDYATTDWTKSQLKITESMITAGIQKVNVDLDGVKTTLQNQITATENSLKSTISKVQGNLDGLQVGGRNLVRNSNYNRVIATYGSDGLNSTLTLPFKAGDNVTITINGYIDQVAKDNGQNLMVALYSSGWADSVAVKISELTETTRQYKFVANQNGYYYINPYKFPDGNKKPGTIKLNWATVVIGNKSPLTWFPAPEDMATQTQFSSLEQTVKGIQTTVSDKANVSELTQLSSQLTSKIIALDSNLSSQITQTKNDINLRVQKDDVINQINISPESVLIAGQKVHITGQTTIDQAVIKSSMIESLSANKIKVGTLSGLSLYGNSIEGGTIDGDVHIRSILNGQYSVMSPEGVTVSTSYDKVALDPNGIVSVSNAVRIYKDSYMSGDYISIYKGSKGLGLYYLFGGHAWVLTTAEMENVY